MAKLRKIQTNFTSGEVSPRLFARVDLNKYDNGLEECLNFIISPYGGLYRRPGSMFVSTNLDSSYKSKLVRFEYSTTQAYILEFCNSQIRFFKDQGVLLNSRGITNGTFASGITGWTSRNSGTGAISHDAGNQRLTLTGGGAGNEARAYQSLVNFGISTYTCSLDVFTASVNYRVGTTVGGSEVTSGTLTTGVGKTFTFTPATNTTLYVEFESTATSSIDNIVLDNPEYIIDCSYLQADLDDLRFAQSFDYLIIVHGDYPVAKLVRNDVDNWELSALEFDEPAYLDINNTTTTLTPSGTSGSITVTSSTSLFASTDVGRAIRFKAGPDKSDSTSYIGTGTQVRFDIPFYPQGQNDVAVYKVAATGVKTLQVYTSNYTISNGQVVMGSAPSTSETLIIEPINAGSGEWGWMTITAYSSATQVTATVEREIAGTNASTYWQLGAWSDTTGYPKAVCFHQQRLWFANTDEQSQTFWASEIGAFSNFQPDNELYKGDVDDSTAFTFTLGANKSQAITWLASKGAMLIGTVNGVYSVRGSNNQAVSATSISANKETDIPCDFSEVSETANEVLFIERLGKKVYSLYYTYEKDGYVAEDLTLLAEHLGNESKITSITYQPIPANAIWATREDGSVLSCTYIKGQDVTGWSVHNISGTAAVVESITTIPGTTRTEVWLETRRTVNGSQVRHVEVLNDIFFLGSKEDSKFLDAMATYDGAATTTVSGLTWLEGETVSVLADGSVHPDVVVSSGSITLNYSASVVQVGLNYTSRIRTLSLEGGSVIGTAQSALARISKYAVKFFETIGGKIGFDYSNLDVIQFRNASDSMDTSPSLFSGFKKGAFPKGFDDEYKVCVQQDQPLPMTILGIVTTTSVEDN